MAKPPATPYQVYVKDATGKFSTPVSLSDLLAQGNNIFGFAATNNTATLTYSDANGDEKSAEIVLVETNELALDPVAKTLTSTVNGVASAPIDITALVADINVDTVAWDQGTFILTLTETDGTVHTLDLASLVPVTADMSIKGTGTDTDPLKLDGDEAAPGNSKYYGTDGAGTKGYHVLPAGTKVEEATDAITAEVVEDIPLEGYGDESKMLWAPAVWLKVLGADGLPLQSGGKTILIPGYLAD